MGRLGNTGRNLLLRMCQAPAKASTLPRLTLASVSGRRSQLSDSSAESLAFRTMCVWGVSVTPNKAQTQCQRDASCGVSCALGSVRKAAELAL
ncbi:hypothetical protein XELAEV_18033670mg [Xenopus laevis]|uniref:Uncharacterized protein n=1 Tax=Xenopus laevis TaxID=8355 RepID=A0A974CKF6_XENLA|nr:hypothetical protein XELAEV_18033670mg [Xenopus laevis]